MAKQKHLNILHKGVARWNLWRANNPKIRPDLSNANLFEVNLIDANLEKVNLSHASLGLSYMVGSNLADSNLSGCDFARADLSGTCLSNANLSGAILRGTDFTNANLTRADLRKADLTGAYLRDVNLLKADLTNANLKYAVLVDTNLEKAKLSDCHVYGISTWNINTSGTEQLNLIVTPDNEQKITVDNLIIAQFIYLLLNNKDVNDVIDTITSKVVLILGRFTDDRKIVLDAIRKEIRRCGYIPLIFDFVPPKSKDLTGTVELLARMARFIIADITDPSCIPHELATIVPFLRTTPVLPLQQKGADSYSMFEDLERSYNWVLPTKKYHDLQSLISNLSNIIAPADELAERFKKS